MYIFPCYWKWFKGVILFCQDSKLVIVNKLTVWGQKPLPIGKDFSVSKIADFNVLFCCDFSKLGLSFKVYIFCASKWLILLEFFQNFCEIGPTSKDLLTKWDTSKDFCEKNNPFAWHIPLYLMYYDCPHEVHGGRLLYTSLTQAVTSPYILEQFQNLWQHQSRLEVQLKELSFRRPEKVLYTVYPWGGN